MTASTSPPDVPRLLDRELLREGLLICRRRPGWFPAKAIMLATASRWGRIYKDAWNHDAIIVRDPEDGRLKIGDALMGPGCVLTPIEEWEKDCVENGTKIIVLEVVGATREQELAAAAWWLKNVHTHKYDKVAIWQIGLRYVFGEWFTSSVGLASRYYCSEGVRDSYQFGVSPPLNPWRKKNVDPGDTRESWKAERLAELMAYTKEGLQYRIAG